MTGPAALPAEPIRLAKAVADRLACSRREAEQYITEGWVRVNGVVVDVPQYRVTTEPVEIDPKARLQTAAPAALLLHKPAGLDAAGAQALLRSATHWPGDPSGLRVLKQHFEGLTALLALPAPAAGLAVFSQDRGVVRKLQEDANVIEQELVVEVSGTIAAGGLARLGRGLLYQGQPLPPARVSWQSEQRLRFAVKGIRPDVVPWMCEQVGLRVTALRRLRIGRVPLAGVPPGQWRYLPPGERF